MDNCWWSIGYFLTMALVVVGLVGAYRMGKEVGRRGESRRCKNILHRSLNITSSPTVRIALECIGGITTTSEMELKLVRLAKTLERYR